MPHEVVYNTCYGGFGLSDEAMAWLKARKPSIDSMTYKFNVPRHDPDLIAVVKELGSAANGGNAELEVYQLEGNVYKIEEYDGVEDVVEPEDVEWVVIE